MNVIKEWTYKGKRCKITKDEDLGHYCGYVQTGLRGPINHPDNKTYELFDVNGGITYGVDEDGWMGFDCAHSHDICVDKNGELTSEFFEDRKDESSVVWSPEDVKEEVEDFADQIIALENVVHKVKSLNTVSEDFDPYEADRPPRNEGFSEETQEICELIQEERGDQRIGQFLINAVRSTDRFDAVMEKSKGLTHKEAVEDVLWSMEAPELLEAIQEVVERHG